MALHDHLGADEHIRLAPHESGKNPLITVLGPCGVRVHAQRSHCRKHLPEFFLYLLGARLEAADVLGGAFWTGLRLWLLIAAVMAHQHAPARAAPVLRQGHVAVGTFHHMAAGTAGHEARVSPPVQEQDALLPFG